MSYEIDINEDVVEIYDQTQRYYLSAYDTTDQTNAGATSVNKMTYNTTDISSGISIVSNSRITIANAGIYNIQFSAQLAKSDSGDDIVDIWLCKNGNNVANSNTQFTVLGNNGNFVAAWNFVVQASAGDYYELCWASADTAMRLDYIAAQTSPTRPAIPSVIVTVTQV